MNAKLAVLAVLGAAVTMTSVAAAGPEPAKQRVAINVTILPSGTGVLTSLKAGIPKLQRDAGTFSGNWQSSAAAGRDVMRDGQTVTFYPPVVWTFTGKRGDLVFNERTEWVELGHDQNRDGTGDGIGTGTWKVVRGTGAYGGVKGGGGSAHLGMGRKWVARYEGFLVLPKG